MLTKSEENMILIAHSTILLKRLCYWIPVLRLRLWCWV